MDNKTKSSRNKTLSLSDNDIKNLETKIITLSNKVSLSEIQGKTINQDIFDTLDLLPEKSVDLLITDPPYNLTKTFNNNTFKSSSMDEYEKWLESWISKLPRILKPTASIYICGDWRSSPALYYVLQKYFCIQNRITWEREKGRGAKTNWKNAHEDIWFCTMSNKYTFNVDDIKVKRKVIAPYKVNGKPKDWEENDDGKHRLTYPSNMMTDLTVPFWSMPENTDHPTQKPEKLIAKLILASSNKGDVVFDTFLGSGTTSVVAKKLQRRFFGVELEKKYALLAEKRLKMVDDNDSIQGYSGGVFWERNSLAEQKSKKTTVRSESKSKESQNNLFSIFPKEENINEKQNILCESIS
ncbi:MAG: site-specific DNA-methyltransferase [Alphaproteobacteria bacterium]|nr:site-specific DNA-methyltransferase [Alphaproteobacteria bacterium]